MQDKTSADARYSNGRMKMYDKELLSEEFYIDDDGIKLHMKLDRPAG